MINELLVKQTYNENPNITLGDFWKNKVLPSKENIILSEYAHEEHYTISMINNLEHIRYFYQKQGCWQNNMKNALQFKNQKQTLQYIQNNNILRYLDYGNRTIEIVKVITEIEPHAVQTFSTSNSLGCI